MRLAIGPLLILAMLAPLGARAQATPPTGRLVGVLIDSIGLEGARPGEGFRRVAGATISLGEAGRRVTTDSLGRFEATGLAPGRYRLSYWAAWLDRIGLPPLGGLVDVVADSAVGVVLATPSLGTYQRLQCDVVLPEGRGVLIGDVRGDGGEPLQGVEVLASWTEMRIKGTSIARASEHRTSRSTASGGFVLCDLPIGGELALAVTRGGRDTASVVVGIPAAVSRRDLALGETRRPMRVSGTVMDSAGRAVTGATIAFIADSVRSARTDATGRFTIVTDRGRSEQVIVRAIGHEPARVDVEPVGSDVELEDIRLRPLAQGLDTVRVTARDPFDGRAGFERRRLLGAGSFVTEEMLRRIPRVTVPVIVSMSRQTEIRSTRRGPMLTVRRGPGFCDPTFFIDGIREGVLDPVDQNLLFDRAKRVEVYTANMAPPEFADFEGCGAVVVWTR